ncbi:hypothetical protein HOS86_gp084 [Klebsiella phage vB_KpnM_KpS110]|uniref:Uncharacterized protein n=1 Tax=Klebsiella phage vB_KpnM_KpS110 TaxID=2079262 RepID=A0A2K9VAG7_9CAUD|nr:hypothetical protein HOS86_gp084 [Klebsiella phage vB_KpnM_KpS110]UJD04904.1 hypothetical protein PWKp5_00161 [Klebsiella phage PWKp5]UPW36178.1 hypothetical protein K751_00172 [Klebsiella phage K751]URG13752.1 hypothetical protein T751_00195 [Klebsiella phage T751]URG17871.1 hypothetical protein T765_00032 [Klebsiella phage T765]WJJ58783.1 hypothetical protein MDA2066_orf102 [Klebsiella phage vB_KpnS_MDA2066]CAD5240777.1 hypothetical protein NBNDMPCG_00126 [Klebsiella phage vB_KqM-Westerb
MKKSTSGIAAMLALTEMESIASHRGDDMWGRRYTQGGVPGEPGHGRPSVKRPKKAKTHGKNKRKRK